MPSGQQPAQERCAASAEEVVLWHAVMIGITGSRTVNAPIAEHRLWTEMPLQVADGRQCCAKLADLHRVTGRASHVPPYRRLPHGWAWVCAECALPGE